MKETSLPKEASPRKGESQEPIFCMWCGKEIKPSRFTGYDSVDGKRKWYHERWGYWCRDSTGMRRAPKPREEK